MSEYIRKHLPMSKFIMEAGIKLRLNSMTVATAASLYHKFFSLCRIEEYDPYLIATTSLYLAGKIEEQHVKLRDVVNVSYRCFHTNKPALEISETYRKLRDSVVNTELLILRMLKFRVSFQHPHKQLLHYLKSINDWLDAETKRTVPLSQTSWAFLNDCYLSNICLKHRGEHVAVAVIYLALQCLGTEVPCNETAEYRWWEVFCADITPSIIKAIVRDIIRLYEIEVSV